MFNHSLFHPSYISQYQLYIYSIYFQMISSNVSTKQVAQLLAKTFEDIPKHDRNIIQSNLLQLEQNPEFIFMLTEILQKQSNDKIRASASLYLSKYIKSVIGRANQTEINNSSEKILNMLRSKIPLQFKFLITSSLYTILQNDNKSIVRRVFQNNLIKQSTALVTTNQFIYQYYEYIALYGQLMISTLKKDAIGQLLIQKTLENFFEISLRILALVTISQQQNSYQQLIILLKSYIHLIKLCISKMNFQINPSFIKFFYDARFENLITTCFNLAPLTRQIRFISTESTKTTNILNSLKDNCIQLINKALKHLFSNVTQITFLQTNLFFMKTPEYLQKMVQSFFSLLKIKKHYSFGDKEIYQLTSSILLFLTSLIQKSYFYSFFFNNRKTILGDIIFPLLELSNQQIHQYQNDPEEFVNLINFILGNTDKNQQNLPDSEDDTLQLLAAKLLLAFCRYQDGCTAELISNSLNALKQKSHNIQQYLLLLAIISYSTAQRLQIHLQIKSYLEQQIPLLLNPINNQLEKINRALKLIILARYSNYLDQIDNTFAAQISLQLCLHILSGNAINPRQQVLEIISLDILNAVTLINNLAVYERSSQILEILTKLMEYEGITIKLYDTLLSLFKDNSEKICQYPNLVLVTVRYLVNKIILEVKYGDSQIIINKCWNILRNLGQDSNFVKILDNFQVEISPLFTYMKQPEKIDFQEDIILLVSSIIKQRKSVSPIELELFQFFPSIFQKFRFNFAQLFELINLFIVFGKNHIQQSTNAISIILQLSFKAMFVQANPRNQADNCQGALILQNLIINCANALTAEFWYSIIENTYKRLQTPAIYKPFLKANLLDVLALALINCYKILELPKMELIMNLILSQLNCIVDAHPSKVYVLALTEWLKITDCQLIIQRYSRILDSIITLLKLNYSRNKTVDQKQIKDNQDSNYDISISTFHSPLSSLDQYQNFKTVFNNLKQTSIQLLQQSFQKLPAQKKQFLKTIVQMVKVQNSYRPIVHVKRNI